MKKTIILISYLLTASANLFANYYTDWIKPADNYQKSGCMIARDNADNVVVTGYIQAQNIYTRKYDKFGNFMWERTDSSGIHSNYEKPRWVNCDKNKNIYVVGYRYTWSSSWEYPDAVVVLKYNASGTLLWKQNISLSYIVGSSTGLAFNLKSEIDNNGNLYIGTAGTSPSGFVLIKLNPAGTVLVNTTKNLGTIHGFASMRLKGDKVIVTGTASYNQNLAIVAWDTAGTFLWSKVLGGFSGKDVEIDGSGNSYILTTYPNQVSSTSGNDVVIYKFNSAGVQTWTKKFDFGGEETATRFTLVSNKLSVIAFGSINASYFDWITFQITTGGAMLWNARYNETAGNDEQPYFIAAKASGEVFVTGKGGPMFTQPNGSSYLRMITLKYGNTGVTQWVDSLNIYSGWGIACTIASDSSLFVLSGTNMTAFHFLDHTGVGSCGIPSGLNTTNVKNTSATFSWTPVAGAYLYHLRFKTISAVDWTTVSTNLNSINIKPLTAGTSYNYAVEAICNSGPSAFSPSQNFTTTGTGYCTTAGQDASTEYLTFVWIGAIQNVSASNNGYADFTNLSTPLTQGATVYGYLSATLPYGLSEYYSVWIDYNHDNDFTDAGELAVNISSTFLGYIAINFTVPANAIPGATRMRVTMRYDSPASPCGSYPRGETEDYAVNITAQQPASSIAENSIATQKEIVDASIFPNPANDYIILNLHGWKGITAICVYDVTGKLMQKRQFINTNQSRLDISSLKSGLYMLRVLDEGGHLSILKFIKE